MGLKYLIELLVPPIFMLGEFAPGLFTIDQKPIRKSKYAEEAVLWVAERSN